ncbi:MAG TPA: uroporphyrinogen-III C-methyltransferase [Candidatus Syntrophoarchaeum butanivorans]|uniref:uroporphyrinogen-III C-methyltransferase n=1 Tax=Candidatus Syntropharchaeum butanivorans TaxID=1839936 RepID=A0A7C0X255_9EURY|nr:MAG: uroporphyrinogen-III C-methyltransferase [Candidatus Syntrophoarchaeum sp. WYZ-LMO15]HDM35771.1 uroporphyrinogen-III C-methyltransferase [Candidatus Syntrophoarchaeum butanivorans]
MKGEGKKAGKVYLVGSGPGDPELLTIKARRIIDGADVILYDQLCGKEIINSLPERAELISVGKFASKHTVPQKDINRLLIEKARDGKVVVRLKGGDPYLFGRGGEEAEEVAAAGIPVEVVPGITSAIAVPAYVGIPVTHRDYASSVTFVTGHEGAHKEEEILEWDVLSQLSGTLVILMGVGGLSRNIDRLLSHGKDPSTPVAIIENGTRKDQRVVTGTLGDIVEVAHREGVKPPAVIVIGDVVRLYGIIPPNPI